MPIISFLVNHIYKSLFLRGEEGFRKAHAIVKTLFILTTIYLYVVKHDYLSTFYLLTLVVLLSLVDKGVKWIYSVTILSLIPALWYALTSYLFILLGLTTQHVDTPLVFLRTFTLSYMIIFYASIISPTTIYNILLRIGLRRQAVAPLLTWRIIPYGLVNMVEALSITKLKKEKIGRRIAPAIASIIEIGNNIRESSYPKIYGEPTYAIPRKTSREYNIILGTTIIVTIAYYLLANSLL